MIGCLRTRVRKQPIIAFYFEFENELKFYNLEAWFVGRLKSIFEMVTMHPTWMSLRYHLPFLNHNDASIKISAFQLSGLKGFFFQEGCHGAYHGCSDVLI